MISIVIPAFNEAKVINECLESLQKQDFTGDFEIILVDNGSTDKKERREYEEKCLPEIFIFFPQTQLIFLFQFLL